MIIKRWTGSWTETYPKTTAEHIYTNNGTTQIFSGNKIKIDYLPDAVFDSLYFQATLNAGANTGALADLWVGGIDHAILNRKSASAFKGYYYQISTAGTISAQGTASSGGVQGTIDQGDYFAWTFNNQDGGTGSGSSGYLEAGDWIVVENVSGDGTSASSPYFLEFSVVNNVYELMTGATSNVDGAPGLVPTPTAGEEGKFLRGDGNFAVPSEAGSLSTARTIELDGDVSGSASFDGSADITITATVANNSHDHTNYLEIDGTNSMTGDLSLSTSSSSAGSASRRIKFTSTAANGQATTRYLKTTAAGELEFEIGLNSYEVWTEESLTNLNQLTNGPGFTSNTGTVTSVSGGNGLTGSITTSGSLAVGSGEGITVSADAVRATYPLYVQTGTPSTAVTNAIWYDIN